MGKFQISQAYKGAAHDGLDLVGAEQIVQSRRVESIQSLLAFDDDVALEEARFFAGRILDHLVDIGTFRNVVYQLLDDFQTFQYFIHADQVACPRITFSTDNLFKIHLIIYGIWLL